ncbi:hypothetical protein E2C01_020942 [Portunus trituberculatus]|uniref:Uncharacterized protein n=1 Tax=Portunus trituberculatus TaxID=210409 RepID=A0A5B7E190_PORTR|nr:hypothetical protein [Portunus trituberculatus]
MPSPGHVWAGQCGTRLGTSGGRQVLLSVTEATAVVAAPCCPHPEPPALPPSLPAPCPAGVTSRPGRGRGSQNPPKETQKTRMNCDNGRTDPTGPAPPLPLVLHTPSHSLPHVTLIPEPLLPCGGMWPPLGVHPPQGLSSLSASLLGKRCHLGTAGQCLSHSTLPLPLPRTDPVHSSLWQQDRML